jgi:hypothetical protein
MEGRVKKRRKKLGGGEKNLKKARKRVRDQLERGTVIVVGGKLSIAGGSFPVSAPRLYRER